MKTAEKDYLKACAPTIFNLLVKRHSTEPEVSSQSKLCLFRNKGSDDMLRVGLRPIAGFGYIPHAVGELVDETTSRVTTTGTAVRLFE